ncbi:hypothetical protein AMAG_04505 [Allomyces macrogynus ATCC 38327]|uniref:ER membrane protein complex subunit 7 beta-sandwich domain-containing protein n=1 Tax=Allomyces macrogynus (strain ATCC 38327) TaxID=578462 RepID=A0A0L0S5A6_ALLM3|nr:hypothetical protein AMAG_04505 [Allomyces macrogynus ATCC 38327]|eukprot:KNE57640.1 hypothetical protein AMAG_04505 [Allomyces macrogynus ATCC 38327]
MTHPWTVLAALVLALVALATHCATALRTVHIHVHGPLLADAAASASTATDDAAAAAASSTAASVLAPVVSGGLLRVNMTAIAPVPRNGVITLSLPDGRHRLSLTHPDYAFDDLLVTLAAPDTARFAVVALDRPNTAAGKAITTDPVAWSARAHRAYLEHKAGFDPLAMVKSPMMLMSLFSLGMMFVLPKMMEAVEEEAGGRTDDPATTGPNLVHQFKELM